MRTTQAHTYVYGTTQKDVLEKLSKIRGESASGGIADPGRLTLGEYLTRWLDESAGPGSDLPRPTSTPV